MLNPSPQEKLLREVHFLVGPAPGPPKGHRLTAAENQSSGCFLQLTQRNQWVGALGTQEPGREGHQQISC